MSIFVHFDINYIDVLKDFLHFRRNKIKQLTSERSSKFFRSLGDFPAAKRKI